MTVEGYYFDGKKSWILYKDKYGKIVTKRWKDNDK
jgi:hypothetical protein